MYELSTKLPNKTSKTCQRAPLLLSISYSIGRIIDSMNAISSFVKLYFLYSSSSIQALKNAHFLIVFSSFTCIQRTITISFCFTSSFRCWQRIRITWGHYRRQRFSFLYILNLVNNIYSRIESYKYRKLRSISFLGTLFIINNMSIMTFSTIIFFP